MGKSLKISVKIQNVQVCMCVILKNRPSQNVGFSCNGKF
jgi:hypothetical protein